MFGLGFSNTKRKLFDRCVTDNDKENQEIHRQENSSLPKLKKEHSNPERTLSWSTKLLDKSSKESSVLQDATNLEKRLNEVL